MHQTFEVAPPRVPAIIKRNTFLVALSQCFTGAGMSMGFGLGPLMVIALTGSAALAGLSVALFGLSRFLVAYPVGKITDAYGRKPGILLGLGIAMAGSLSLWAAMAMANAAFLMLGLLLFGAGMNAAQQMRVAATDMFPPAMRAQALGYVALGSLVGLIVMPGLVNGGELLAQRSGGDALGMPWLLLPVLILPGMAIITQVRPDPKDIGARLAEYFPGTMPVRQTSDSSRAFSARALLRNAPLRLAIVSNCAAQGNMSVVMVLTSLVLHHHGHSLTAIAVSHTLHSIGMFGFTVPLGRLADRFGREWVMYPGVATTLIGAWLVTFTEGFVPITLGTFLVGLGWAAANVAATALVADHYESVERGRAIGVADSFAGGISVVAALVTGPLIDWSLPAAGLAAVLIAAVPLAMRAMMRAAP